MSQKARLLNPYGGASVAYDIVVPHEGELRLRAQTWSQVGSEPNQTFETVIGAEEFGLAGNRWTRLTFRFDQHKTWITGPTGNRLHEFEVTLGAIDQVILANRGVRGWSKWSAPICGPQSLPLGSYNDYGTTSADWKSIYFEIDLD